MQKIGSGEQGTISGKVYKAMPAIDIGEITRTFCKDKLYARRVDDQFGNLSVINPETLEAEGKMQLDLDCVFKKQSECKSINKRNPLLSDGENLLIVTAEVIKKEKKVREEI
jgi:hypothetical protein